MTQNKCKNIFIKKALETVNKMNQILNNTYNANLEEIKNL
jgi:hypothetical protein